MPRPTQIGAYRLHMDALDLADVNPTGAAVNFQTKSQATRFRMMCYSARKLYFEQTGIEKWSEIVISVIAGQRPDDPPWQVLLRRGEAEPISIIPLDGQYPTQTTAQALDKFYADVAAEAARAPVMIEPGHSERPLGRSTRLDVGDLAISLEQDLTEAETSSLPPESKP